jgi:hypothetical protein
MERILSIVKIPNTLHKCQLQIDHLDQMIFANKNWLLNPRVGRLKHSDLVGACEA